MFTDTGNLLYEIKTEDIYKDFSNNKKMFHFSNFQLSQNIMIIQTN